MNNKKIRILGIVLLLMVLGTTVYAKSVEMAKVEKVLAPKPGQALLVIMRSTFVGSAISASLFDVSTAETKFLGVFKSGVKIAYDIAPGEHTFMVVSESADFMKVTVLEGKTYYALVVPRMGAMKARFSFQPLRQSDLAGSDFKKWYENTNLVENTPETLEWAEKNAPDIESKRSRYWPVWSQKTPEQQGEQTLNPEDGR